MRRLTLYAERLHWLRCAVCAAWMLCAVASADQPGRGLDPDSMNRARIKPPIVELEAGATQQFYVVKEAGRLTGAYAIKDVQWSVNGVPGGNRTVGTITPDGLYHAPGKTPESPEVVVHAAVDDAVNRNHWATVLLDGRRPLYRTVESWTELMDDPITVYYAPPSFALESSGNILIAYNGGIHRYSPDEGPKGESIALKGDSEKDLSGARNIAVDASGRIFVSDDSTGPPRIKVFSPEGEYLFGFGMKGIGEGRVMETRGMAFDSAQRFHIGDVDSMRVSVFDADGGFLHAIGKKGVLPGEFNVPYGIAVDANDDLFAIGYYGPCQKLDRDGQFLLDFAYPDPPDGPILFTDVTTDRWGNAYLVVNGPGDPKSGYEPVLDTDGSRIGVMKYNNNGDWVCNLQMQKKDRQPLRVLVDSNDQVLVLFKEGEKVGIEFMAR